MRMMHVPNLCEWTHFAHRIGRYDDEDMPTSIRLEVVYKVVKNAKSQVKTGLAV